MSVQIHTLRDPEEYAVEVWAPDCSVANVWLVYEDGGLEDRIDLGLDQLRQFRDVANGILGD